MTRYRQPLRVCAALAAATAALFAITSPRLAAGPQARALRGPVDEVYADPRDALYSYGPSALERAMLQGTAAFTADISVTYDAGFNANPQARAAFQAAVDIWKSVVASPAPIRVAASFRPLGTGVLGSAGPLAICSTSGGVPNTFYAAALADKLNGAAFCASLAGTDGEISANFNSTFTNWDFGTNGVPVAGKYNFLTVVLHEIGHGLGFYGSMDASGGVGSFGYGLSFPNFVDIYDRFAVTGAGAALLSFANPSAALGAQLVSNNTFFSGAAARTNNGGLNPKLETHNFGASSDDGFGFKGGSSYSHIDDALYSSTPNGLMTWALAQAEVYTDPGPIVRGIFTDVGWTIQASSCSYALSPASASVGAGATTGAVTVAAGAGCAWTAASNASWLTVTGSASGSGNGSVTYAVAANYGGARTGALIIGGQAFVVSQSALLSAVRGGEFDGDGKTDIGVFRPSTGTWYIKNSSAAAGSIYSWGAGADVPVARDYDGDGKSDVAVFRPSTGVWYILNSSTGGGSTASWGGAADIPVPADYDGDGKADVAVFRPATGAWYILNSRTATPSSYSWGAAGDLPVPGDYDGDGKSDVAVFRPSTGVWYILNSATGGGSTASWGGGGDIPVAADYDNDGKTDVAVFRPSTGAWYILNSRTATPSSYSWGAAGDIPVLGDRDGDGNADIGVYRPSAGTWYFINSSTGSGGSAVWGGGNDIPS